MDALDLNGVDLASADGLFARLTRAPNLRNRRVIRRRLAAAPAIVALATLR